MKQTRKSILDAGRKAAHAPTHGILLYDAGSPTGWRIYDSSLTRHKARKVAARMQECAGAALKQPGTGIYAMAEPMDVVLQHAHAIASA